MKSADTHPPNYRRPTKLRCILEKVRVTYKTTLSVHPDRVPVLICECQDTIIIKNGIPPLTFHDMVISHPDVVFYRESDTISG